MFIRTSLQKEFKLNRIFLIVYILIDRNRSIEDMSYITIGQVLRKCGYRNVKRKTKIFFEVLKCLLFLRESNLIECEFDIYTVNYNDCIEIRIIKENFDVKDGFTKIYGKDLDMILDSDTRLSKESLLTVYLYVVSFIGSYKDSPGAFFRSIESMSRELSMSKDTISRCLDYLTDSSDLHPALLVKKEVGSIQTDKVRPPKNIPNIYVLNKKGYKKEIAWAEKIIKEKYKVDKFYPLKNGNYQFH